MASQEVQQAVLVAVLAASIPSQSWRQPAQMQRGRPHHQKLVAEEIALRRSLQVLLWALFAGSKAYEN